jgi:hypothetical protein
MTDIALGQSIAGSLTINDTKASNFIDTYYIDEYNLTGVDKFTQLDIKLEGLPADGTIVRLLNSATGAVIAQDNYKQTGKFSISQTTLPGVNYKIQIGNSKLKFGAYTLSTIDGGKATSIVNIGNSMGTIGASGTYFPIDFSGFGTLQVSDEAIAPNGQLYVTDGIHVLGIDPSKVGSTVYVSSDTITDDRGKNLAGGLSAIEFTADNKLYAIELTSGGLQKLDRIDLTTKVATSVGNLPVGLLVIDMVYDAAKNRFLAASPDAGGVATSLWQIPVDNPSGATKIGRIGSGAVTGLSFENSQLTGFSTNDAQTSQKITIDPNTGVGTLGSNISGVGLVSHAATIPSSNIVTTNPPPNNPVPTSPVNAIGTKSQGLAEGRTIDLTDYPGKILKVDTVTKGDAAYNNNIGFYVVQDSIGTIKLGNGSLLKPGDANYAVEAIKSAVLRAAKIDSKSNQDIAGGNIYAPVVVAQGSLDDFVSKNPTNGGDGKAIHAYFNYIGANPDKFDHFRLNAPNTFGVEDLYGGGDKDFNDLVVNMNVKTA